MLCHRRGVLGATTAISYFIRVFKIDVMKEKTLQQDSPSIERNHLVYNMRKIFYTQMKLNKMQLNNKCWLVSLIRRAPKIKLNTFHQHIVSTCVRSLNFLATILLLLFYVRHNLSFHFY